MDDEKEIKKGTVPEGCVNPEVFTEERILKAIPGSFGLTRNIAARLGCAYTTISHKAAKYPAIRKAIEEEKEVVTDQVVQKAIQLMLEEDNTALILHYLKTKGKSHGFAEKQEIDLNISKIPPLKINFSNDDDIEE